MRTTLSLFASLVLAAPAVVTAESLTYQTPRELFGTGDFDGDGRLDAVIVDKDSGKVRLGYQQTAGLLSWVDNRPSGVKSVTGFSPGKLLNDKTDALAFTSPEAGQFSVVDVSSMTSSSRPKVVTFEAALGPNAIVAIDVGGQGNTPLADLVVGSTYNDPNLLTLLRNDAAEFPKVSEMELAAPLANVQRIALKPGGPDAMLSMANTDAGAIFRVQDVSGAKPSTLAEVKDLPKGTEFVAARFAADAADVLFFQAGANKISVRRLDATGKLGAVAEHDLGQPVVRLVAVPEEKGAKLLAIVGTGEQALLFAFDGQQAPAKVQTFGATNDFFTCAAPLPNGLVLFTQPSTGKYSTRYQTWKASGKAYAAGPYGSLPTLADNDNLTIPDIHSRIVKNLKVSSEQEMQTYTNTIPGTRVTYVMLPIKGGEFTMGSPDAEANRQPDEGPQHKVKVEPFWMAKCEITWNEYELFMYPDEEKRTRAQVPTDAAGDKLADAVTHPSRPYVEMSFGMGKDGYPAISMTQHAANKYCQWLSAKTGEFYRLPTEAEWEYAARAGTTTPYFFGDDESKLAEYAWYEQNSDFKYQKVGKKKPNPWGLHDIYGNAVEWVLDQYDPEIYKARAAKGEVVSPWNRATKPYPHAVRGGSWDDQASSLRSAARRGSERAWKMQDPQLPKSIWYFSDAQFLGFRVVRPLKVPPPEELQKYWSSGVERD